tara:strand:- start:10362 stop:11573 length:1212 start_codon:yes stop_codon:yes gene_type:complete
MAIIRLTDVVATMKSKWTYGDKFFGYTEEFNDNHSIQYPSLLITPPDSLYPEATPRNGWEEYAFEVYFSDLYNRTQQANETIEQRWDNLQDLANEWLDMFLKSYIGIQEGKTTISYLTDGSLAIERKKEVANDQVLQIKMNFNWKVFSKCFIPVSNYPTEISGLSSWLRVDSNVTFSIPTKKVSAVGDGSGNANGVAQSSGTLQPLRYTYGGGTLDKTQFRFRTLKLNVLNSDNNFVTTLADEQFSIFEVSTITNVSNAVFGYFHLTDGSYIEMGTNAGGNYEVSVSDGTTLLTKNTGTVNTGIYHIASLRKAGTTIDFNYYDSLNSIASSDTNGAFVSATSFQNENFRIGCTQISDGLIPPAAINTKHLEGNFQELIIYDRKLSDAETATVVDYLNKKYKIY